MRKIDKVVRWFDKWLPYIWGFLVVALVTSGLVGLLFVAVKWIFKLVGEL